MRAGDELIVELGELAPSGEALAPAGERPLLVDGGLPGELVKVRVTRVGEDRLHGEIVEVQRPSPQRVAPACRHASECGGCSWQHVAYAEQLRLKQGILEKLLREALGSRAPRVQPMLGMPLGPAGAPIGFRQKAAFVFGQGPDGALVMGHFARASHKVVPVTECPVHSPRANRVAFTLRDALSRARMQAAGQTHGVLRHLVVRTTADDSEAAAVLVVTAVHQGLRVPLERLLASPEKPTGLMLNVHDRPGPYLVGRETLRVDGLGHVKEERLGPSFIVSPTGFFQTNVAAAAELVRLVTAALPPRAGLRVLDLYSGSGLFALPIAVAGHTVTAVEESRKATRDAGRNGKLNGVPPERLRLVCGRVEHALSKLGAESWDVAILDPPREGCPPQVLRDVAERLRPERLVLVSCNPEALARELGLALRAGYRATLVQPVDMFPHTPHVETVAVLERGKAEAREARRPSGARPAAAPRRGGTDAKRRPGPPADRGQPHSAGKRPPVGGAGRPGPRSERPRRRRRS